MREYTPFELWQEMLNQMFGPSLRSRAESSASQPRGAMLPVDVWLTEDALILEANLPGANPEDVDITFEGDTLVINAMLPEPEVEGKSIIRERYHGPVHRALNLDIPVDQEKAEAVFKNGVLRLTIPRADKARTRKIQVKAE